VVKILRDGYGITFHTPPPTTTHPVEIVPKAGQAALLQLVIDILLNKGAVEIVIDITSPGFYSRIFLVEKASGGWRPVTDLSLLNTFIVIPRFKMMTSQPVIASVNPGDWATSIDLTDAYFQIPIKTSSQKYLRFAWEGVVYQFKALPFGIATAPRIVTKVMKPLIRMLRISGIRSFHYIDDWMIVAAREDMCAKHTDFTVRWTQSLGYVINEVKSSLAPSQNVTYLGMFFDLRRGYVQLTEKR